MHTHEMRGKSRHSQRSNFTRECYINWAVGTCAAGPAAAGPMFSEPTKKIIIITALRTLDSFTTRIWTGNETTYTTYPATHAHMDVTTFNMAETHFPRRKRLVFQSDSLVLRVIRGVSTLSDVTR